MPPRFLEKPFRKDRRLITRCQAPGQSISGEVVQEGRQYEDCEIPLCSHYCGTYKHWVSGKASLA